MVVGVCVWLALKNSPCFTIILISFGVGFKTKLAFVWFLCRLNMASYEIIGRDYEALEDLESTVRNKFRWSWLEKTIRVCWKQYMNFYSNFFCCDNIIINHSKFFIIGSNFSGCKFSNIFHEISFTKFNYFRLDFLTMKPLKYTWLNTSEK